MTECPEREVWHLLRRRLLCFDCLVEEESERPLSIQRHYTPNGDTCDSCLVPIGYPHSREGYAVRTAKYSHFIKTETHHYLF